ncbi:hypothetical protein BDZ94DRAFT_1306509 [Collybia nuda]|uniref:C2H2-type domain-containing protein n=1 Tax=Collybia nuda TaxID=64659 RepID=A0A9P5YED6_9AGAR|nr:hypothetical protein BDZ94DRAFT_1306509 [Collybia nuda]
MVSNRNSPVARPLVTLPSFRESFPASLSEPDLTPICEYGTRPERYNFKAIQSPSATFIPPLVTPHMRVKPYIFKSREVLSHHPESISRSYERPIYESVCDMDAHSLPPPSDDDTSSVSSSSGLDSNAEANYSPMASSSTEYRYPPLLPEPRLQQQLGQITPQYLHSSDNRSAPPSGSVSNVPESRRVQAISSTRGLPDRPKRALSRPIGNDVLKWLEYAEEVRDENGAIHYQCRWEKGGRLPTACDYRAQKQAMKRHVEATHLKYRPHKCSFCHNAYSQKTALEVHEATHTGATPHECLFACGRAFSDPARRYRHHVDAHGYVPRQTNKKHGNAQMRVVRDKVQFGT